MTSRSRTIVLAISAPILAFAFIGGYLSQAMAKDGTYQGLQIFEDVVSLVLDNYVEPVDVATAMQGAMRGLANGLDPESAYLTPQLVSNLETADPGGPAGIGLDLTRQYYLRVVSARDNSPAARAGIRPGDFIRAIDNRPTRGMSAYEGERLLRGAPGTTVSLLLIRGNAADPHAVELLREATTGEDITIRMADATTGYIRIVQFSENSASQLEAAVDTLAGRGAASYVIDLRNTSVGDLDDGIAAARLFVKDATLVIRLGRADAREPLVATPSDGAIAAPLALLVDAGTAGAAEVFAAAINGNDRAELIGSNTLGRASRQRLLKLPDDSGLWLTYLRYLTAAGDPIHETGLAPDVDVEQTEIEFGDQAPQPDEALERALERLTLRSAA